MIPKTLLGKWSVGLIISFLLLFATFQLLVASGQRGPGLNPVLAITIIPAGLAGVLAFITGIISIIKSKERSVFVFVATAMGLFVLTFVLGEFLFPH